MIYFEATTYEHAFNLGQDAARRGLSVQHNPFKQATRPTMYNGWNNGYHKMRAIEDRSMQRFRNMMGW